jgi:signal transduction histidine kinase
MQENTNPKDIFSQLGIKEKFDEKKPTILVIDDELGPRESIRMIFKNKYNVIPVESGERGIEVIKKIKVDVIILDLKMGGKNGIETLEEIRKYDEKVPVIILTGYGDMESARKAMHFGVIEFMSKPFDIPELESIVNRVIEKIRIERESERLKDELSSLNSKLLKKFEEIEKLATIGQMSTEVIHEINNLLTVIHGYIQLLLQEVSSKELTMKYITTIESEIKRCKNIAKNIMELAKEEYEIEDVDVNETIEKLINFLKESKLCKNVNFNVELEKSPIIIKANKNHFHQAILNLLLNSAQSIEKEGFIDIKTKKFGDLMIIEIKDNGKGIRQETIEKVLDPFYISKEKTNGIGLSFTAKIIKKYGGNFEVKSEIGKGTEFKIIFPLSQI